MTVKLHVLLCILALLEYATAFLVPSWCASGPRCTRVSGLKRAATSDGDGDSANDNEKNNNVTGVERSMLSPLLARQRQGSSNGSDGSEIGNSITRIPTTKDDLNEMLENGGNILDVNDPTGDLGRTFRALKIDSDNR